MFKSKKTNFEILLAFLLLLMGCLGFYFFIQYTACVVYNQLYFLIGSLI